jgi:hypothetical protein
MNFLSKNIKSKIKFFVITISLSLFFFELFSLVATKFNLLIFNQEPNYRYSSGNKWRNEIKPWGAWHKENYKDRHRTKCFDVEYRSNNLGARDDKVYDQTQPSDSIILIGDSFVEGMGVNLNDTVGKILEKETDRKVLNFGSGGFFGPVQEEILYNDLASKLPHNEMIYFFLPANDFIENDRRYWRSKINRFRHRPYYKKVSDNEYSVFYPSKDSKSKFLLAVQSFLFHRLQVFLVDYTYSANTLRTLSALYIRSSNKEKNIVNQNVKETGYSYFFDDSESVDGSLFFTKKLLSKASNLKRRLIIIIPLMEDFIRIRNGENYKQLKWYLDLKKIVSQTNSEFFDLADHFTRDDYEKMLEKCTRHWSIYGNKIVAKLIMENFF